MRLAGTQACHLYVMIFLKKIELNDEAFIIKEESWCVTACAKGESIIWLKQIRNEESKCCKIEQFDLF